MRGLEKENNETIWNESVSLSLRSPGSTKEWYKTEKQWNNMDTKHSLNFTFIIEYKWVILNWKTTKHFGTVEKKPFP